MDARHEPKATGTSTIHDAAPWIFITTDHRLRAEKNGRPLTKTRRHQRRPDSRLSFEELGRSEIRSMRVDRVRGSSTWKNAKEKRDRDRRRGRVSGMAETRRRSTGRREIVNYVGGWMVDRWPIVRIYGVETSDLRSTVRDKGTILAPTHETTVGPSTKTASLEDPLLSPVSRCPKTLRRRLSLSRRSAPPLDRRRESIDASRGVAR